MGGGDKQKIFKYIKDVLHMYSMIVVRYAARAS